MVFVEVVKQQAQNLREELNSELQVARRVAEANRQDLETTRRKIETQLPVEEA
jgi:hypothetical protein